MKKPVEPLPPSPSASRAQLVVPVAASMAAIVVDEGQLLDDLRKLVRSARQRIAIATYSTQALMCWHVGRRLDREHLQGGRAACGKQILVNVSRELTADYGRGFSYAEIARMIQFAQAFPDGAAADAEQVELLQLDAKSIRVSEYLTALPPLALLRERLHQAMEHARVQATLRRPETMGRA